MRNTFPARNFHKGDRRRSAIPLNQEIKSGSVLFAIFRSSFSFAGERMLAKGLGDTGWRVPGLHTSFPCRLQLRYSSSRCTSGPVERVGEHEIHPHSRCLNHETGDPGMSPTARRAIALNSSRATPHLPLVALLLGRGSVCGDAPAAAPARVAVNSHPTIDLGALLDARRAAAAFSG